MNRLVTMPMPMQMRATAGPIRPLQEISGHLDVWWVMDDTPLYVTTREAARLLSYSRRQTKRFIADGTLRTYKLVGGGTHRIRYADLLALKRVRVQAGSGVEITHG